MVSVSSVLDYIPVASVASPLDLQDDLKIPLTPSHRCNTLMRKHCDAVTPKAILLPVRQKQNSLCKALL